MRLKCTQMEVCILTPPATNQILQGSSSKNDEKMHHCKLRTKRVEKMKTTNDDNDSYFGSALWLERGPYDPSHHAINDEACQVL